MTNGTMHITLRDAKKLKQYLNGELLEVNLFESKGINLQVSLTDVHMPTDEEFVALGFLPHSDKVLLKRGGLELPKLIGKKTAERTAIVGETFGKLKELTNATIIPSNSISEKKMDKMKNLLRTALMHPAHNGNLDGLFKIIRELDADLRGIPVQVEETPTQYDEPTPIPQSGDIPPPIKAVETDNQRRRKERDAQFADEVLSLGGSLPESQVVFKQMPDAEDNPLWRLYHQEPYCYGCDKPVINPNEFSMKHQIYIHEKCLDSKMKDKSNGLEEVVKLMQISEEFKSRKMPEKPFIDPKISLEIFTQEVKDKYEGLHVNYISREETNEGIKICYLIHNGFNIAVLSFLFREDNKVDVDVVASKHIKVYSSSLFCFVPTEDYYTTTHTYINNNCSYLEDTYRFLFGLFHDHEGILILDTLPDNLKLNSQFGEYKYLLEPIK